ncbi:hypothetical protein L198_05523 [Cryptococcus wingfieldii CBS 7118]|uniref:Uncharacterized protein n=1 Tax=Cryptococcus wingfieldii CBS 7118 TaxID=1295528 RepID=A0A1E3IVV7_9TREE|nr:hypothetical protein L198_05523 [Cryptococcus wingfieldii CBS 7118]ODN92729.1 hypothetical protein L198_05523 [Cryptococcus wingfieldii CBS 7118]
MAATAYLWVEDVPTSDIKFDINGGNITAETAVGGTPGLGYHSLDPSSDSVQFVNVTGLTTEISTQFPRRFPSAKYTISVTPLDEPTLGRYVRAYKAHNLALVGKLEELKPGFEVNESGLSPQSSPRLSERSLDLPDGVQTMSASPSPPPLEAQRPSIRHEIHSFHPISNYAPDVQDDIINGSPLRDADLDCYNVCVSPQYYLEHFDSTVLEAKLSSSHQSHYRGARDIQPYKEWLLLAGASGAQVWP